MGYYRKKPVTITAYQTQMEMVVSTLNGDVKASPGDYVITGIKGERYPCKSDIFHETYVVAPTPPYMDFTGALDALREGKKVARAGWNGKGMWAVLQQGYPDGIAINENTSNATGLPIGTVCKFRPYFLLYTAQQDFAHWVPSTSDLLANDWVVVD